MTPSTTWQRIALDLVQKIRTGDTPVGSRIASYRRLTSQYGTSLGTIKRAVEYLQEQGIVKGLQGSGLFVIRVPDEDPTFTPDAPEDLAGRVEKVEGSVDRLTDGQRDIRVKVGELEAALRNLYSATAHPYPSASSQDQPRRSRRKAVGE